MNYNNSLRQKSEKLLLKVVCQLTGNAKTMPVTSRLHRTKVLKGLLRGMYFSMPQLEKLSFALGSYEPHVVQCMQRFIKPGTVTYDIGANAGYLTLIMSQLVQNTGQVLAFEPDPLNFAALNANIQDNDIKNVKTFQKAISNTSGELTFATFEYSLVGHIATSDTPDDATLLQVQAVKLDDFVYDEGNVKPDFIKIDVEGAEDQVLYGAERLLQEVKPVILAEVREGEIYKNIVDFMQGLDYCIEFLSGGWDIEKHQLGDMLFIPNSRDI